MNVYVQRIVAIVVTSLLAAAQPIPPVMADDARTGPETEKRFPPLVVPDGFQVTLFACDPLVEYPSVIAVGPRPGTLFVAHDYLTGLGTEIVRRDEIHLIVDSDRDGYADTSVLYAGEFNSIQGLANHAGTVFVMHAPLLTALRDSDGDGVADERRDLLNGLGLAPEENSTRLHCANGVVMGHDGWLYLAMGDNGTNVLRPEGDRLILNGGGILRCRADGKDLHVFATGLRNIYDVALDEQLNVFVRDNENDGGDYMIRVCHSFHGANHGYPYLYSEHPAEALAPLADLGRGSSAGGVCYRETMFPEEFRGSLLFCEWGRAVVRYRREVSGSSFAVMTEADFAVGPANDPYGFKPTDVVVDHDGSLLVSDWCDGQRPKRGRARIYRISFPASRQDSPLPGVIESNLTGDQLVSQLNSPGYLARLQAQLALESHPDGWELVMQRLSQDKLAPVARLHAVWILSRGERMASLSRLFEIVARDPDPRVRAQAIRAITDLTDPVLVDNRLDSERGDSAVAEQLARLAVDQDARVQLAAVTAMGRLRWRETPDWLRKHLNGPDAALAHAAMWALRQCDNWTGVLEILDEPDTAPMRAIALRAIAEQSSLVVVDGLIERLETDANAQHRSEYADALARIHHRPGAWTYWGYRPAPRPANTRPWERTEAIVEALDRVLKDADWEVRAETLRRMRREGILAREATLAEWLRNDRDAGRVELILDVLAGHATELLADSLTKVIQDRLHDEKNRRKALALLARHLTESDHDRLLHLARQMEDGGVLAELIALLGDRPQAGGDEFLLVKLRSHSPQVRAAAIDSVAKRGLRSAGRVIPELLQDLDEIVRRSTARAAGILQVYDAAPELLTLASQGPAAPRAASLVSLRQLRVSTAVKPAIAALGDAESQLAAIEYLAEFGGPDQLEPLMNVATKTRSAELLAGIVRALDRWQESTPADSHAFRGLESAIARLQADSGLLLRWRVRELTDSKLTEKFVEQPESLDSVSHSAKLFSIDAESNTPLAPLANPHDGAERMVWTPLEFSEPARLQFSGNCNLSWRIWINNRLVHQRSQPARPLPELERFEVEVSAGVNRVLVLVPASTDEAKFQLHFRRASSTAEHERLARFVLENKGDVERGREVFLNAEKSLCTKCHRLNGQGGAIGPDLTGIGRRFSRIHLVESILDPSRTIAPSYETVAVALADGRVLTGVRTAETDETLTLGDNQGKLLELPKSRIEERSVQTRSTMPDGLEKRLTDRELLNLITFLVLEGAPP